MKFSEIKKSLAKSIIKEVDNFSIYDLDISIDKLDQRKISLIKELVHELQKCSLDFEVHLSSQVASFISISNVTFDKFEETFEAIEIDENNEYEGLELEVTVDKEGNDSLHIFSPNIFREYLASITLEECFEHWSKFDSDSLTDIIVWDDFPDFSTRSFLVASKYSEPKIRLSFSLVKGRKSEIILSRNKACHFANSSKIDSVPEDFFLFEGSDDNFLSNHFNTMANCLLVCFISDYSIVAGNCVEYKFKGYKQIDVRLSKDLLSIPTPHELKSIYEWVYSKGDFVDKIGLAKNVISIHLKDNKNLLAIENGTESSIISSFELYLKENVKQYIEIKNKISESLQSQSEKASLITRNLFSSLKSSLWTCSTFFIAVIILKLTKSEVENLSIQIYALSCFMIIVSFVFLWVNLQEVHTEKSRLSDAYDKIKSNYVKLIDEKDLDSMLDLKNTRDKEIEHVDTSESKYRWAWYFINIIFFAVVTLIYLVL